MLDVKWVLLSGSLIGANHYYRSSGCDSEAKLIPDVWIVGCNVSEAHCSRTYTALYGINWNSHRGILIYPVGF